MMMRPFTRRRQERGSVLIVVLVVCLGLVSMTLVFSHAMLLSYRGADNEIAGRQAEAAIQGAERYAETILAQSQTAHVFPDRTAYQNTAVPLGDALFWFIGQPLASDPPNVPAFALVDEASKLNLNAFYPNTILALLPNMTPDLAQAIHDWHNLPGSGGTSSIQLNATKSAPFESPEELALVNGGIDPSVLYGDDANLNHCLDPGEGNGLSSGGALGQFNPGLLEYVTTFSREPNTLPDGTKRGFVSQGFRDNPGLLTALTAALGSGPAQEIQQRLSHPAGRTFTSVMDFCNSARMTTDQWDKAAPYLTMNTGTYATGLVNVNTASATVLSCLPQMTEDLAAQIVAARATQATPSTNLQWIVPILGQNAKLAARWMTTRSYQVSVDVAAVGRNGRGYRRTVFVIDYSAMSITGATTPQIVYRRNLSNLGWALGSDARTSLPTAANIAAGTAKAGTTPTPKGSATP